MSNAAIFCCLSFGARSERHRRPTAAEHSFRSSLFKRVTQTLLETIFAFGSHNFFRGTQTVREEFSWLPDANAYAYRMLSEGPKMNNSLRQ